MKAKSKNKETYIAEYKSCGCTAESDCRRELLSYCALHGNNRIRVHKVITREAQP